MGSTPSFDNNSTTQYFIKITEILGSYLNSADNIWIGKVEL